MTWRERLWTAWSVLRGRITLREHVTSVAVDAADDGRTFSTGFVQWKGTTVCMDATCPVCGHDGHIDADFAYFLKCGACGALCEVGRQCPTSVESAPPSTGASLVRNSISVTPANAVRCIDSARAGCRTSRGKPLIVADTSPPWLSFVFWTKWTCPAR